MNQVKILAHTFALLTLVKKTNGQPDPTRPLVDMSVYKSDARILDCGECFEAKGRMCHNKNYDSMFEDTKSSNMGNAICCKNEAVDDKKGLCGR